MDLQRELIISKFRQFKSWWLSFVSEEDCVWCDNIWILWWLCKPSVEAQSLEQVGVLDLRCCDFSRGCSVASFIGCHESLTAFVLETGAGCVGHWAPVTLVTSSSLKFFRLDVAPPKVHLDSVLVPLPRAVFLSLAGPKLSIQQLRGHAMVVQPDARPTHRSWALMSMGSILVQSSRSRTFAFVIRSWQRRPSREWKARMWKCSSRLTYKSRIHTGERWSQQLCELPAS